MGNDGDTDRLLSERETAEMLGLSLSTLRHWRYISKRDKKLIGPPWVQIGGKRIMYSQAALQTYIADRTVAFPMEKRNG